MEKGRGGRAGHGAGAREGTTERRLRDMQINQLLKRRRLLELQHQLDEINAIKRLAYEVFGDQGVVEVEWGPAGQLFMVGYFLEPPPARGFVVGRQGPMRKTKILFRGAGHKDIELQVRVWKASR